MLKTLMLAMLTMALSSLPGSKMKRLRCCDSTGGPGDILATNRDEAKQCSGIMGKTQPRDSRNRRLDGMEGKNCDFCTIEVFHVKKKEDPDASKVVEETYYYLQSCNSFEPAAFEFMETGLEDSNDHHIEKLRTHKKLNHWIDFGVDLQSKNLTQLKRACKHHQKRQGFALNIYKKDAGIEVHPFKTGDECLPDSCEDGQTCSINTKKEIACGKNNECPDPQPCKHGHTCSNGGPGVQYDCSCDAKWVGTHCDKEPLDTVESIVCACFDDECNSHDEIIPKEEDWKKGSVNWEYR